jgi:hypothetical protein
VFSWLRLNKLELLEKAREHAAARWKMYETLGEHGRAW